VLVQIITVYRQNKTLYINFHSKEPLECVRNSLVQRVLSLFNQTKPSKIYNKLIKDQSDWSKLNFLYKFPTKLAKYTVYNKQAYVKTCLQHIP
jgi:hypothetical protein